MGAETTGFMSPTTLTGSTSNRARRRPIFSNTTPFELEVLAGQAISDPETTIVAAKP